VIPALLAALLTACAAPPPKPWVKDGGNLAQDQAVCEFEAEKGAVSSDPNGVIAAFEKADRRRKIMDFCMRSKGWTR
jgi:hypothetical protein